MLKSELNPVQATAATDVGCELKVSRREVLASLIGSIGWAALPRAPAEEVKRLATRHLRSHLPPKNLRWYGFNLIEYFSTDPDWMKYSPYTNDGAFREDDFRWMRDWGFNFVRLPMDYRFWTDPDDLSKIHERKLEPIDRAVRLGERYGIHINICPHRAPGYCILDSLDPMVTGICITPETTNLFTDSRTLDAIVYQWTVFAKRYKGISSDQLSFNLLNEPKVFNTAAKRTSDAARGGNSSRGLTGQMSRVQGARDYARIVHAAIDGIRAVDPDRLIVIDGIDVATEPLVELASARKIVQSVHHYYPQHLTFYKAPWARGKKPPEVVPSWPLEDTQHQILADRKTMETFFQGWRKATASGVSIHCGEMGCDKRVSPQVTLAWFGDAFDVLGELKAGWALWNFRGPFGVLDTGRPGTKFENWYGHQLDRPLLNLLQEKKK